LRVLVTGATGFVGAALCRHLAARGHVVRAAVRSADRVDPDAGSRCAVGEIGPGTDWRQALAGCNAIAHLAARVHVMHDSAADPLAEFRTVNVEGTRKLIEHAAEAGVRSIVYASTIKVNGVVSPGRGFVETDPPAPADPYAISKWEAEQLVADRCARAGIGFTIVRPPLVYGPGVKANFLRLMRTVDQGLPVPLGAIHNRRSLIYVRNLADVLARCLEVPAAGGKTYLVSDGDDVSTPELIRRVAAALGKPARLIGVPPPLLRVAARLVGRAAEYDRLVGDLAIDSSAIRRELGWEPPFGMVQALAETASWYRSLSGRRNG
jgi:nucleoside-diphosphate-sugar epimerase